MKKLPESTERPIPAKVHANLYDFRGELIHQVDVPPHRLGPLMSWEGRYFERREKAKFFEIVCPFEDSEF